MDDVEKINHTQHLLSAMNKHILQLQEENKLLKQKIVFVRQCIKEYQGVHGFEDCTGQIILEGLEEIDA